MDKVYGEMVMRTPLKVFARMWTPHSKIPDVREITREVIPAPTPFNPDTTDNSAFMQSIIQPPLSPLGDMNNIPSTTKELEDMWKSQLANVTTGGVKPFSVVTHGMVKLYGEDKEEVAVRPRDYILYHSTKKLPLSVISEEEYESQYSGQPIEFCESCKSKLGYPSSFAPSGPEEEIEKNLKAFFEKGEVAKIMGPDGTLETITNVNEYKDIVARLEVAQRNVQKNKV
jgi:hypothetical protein